MLRRSTRGSIAKATANARSNFTPNNNPSDNNKLSKKQTRKVLLDTSDEASVGSIIEETTPTLSKSKTRGSIARKLVNISLSPNVNLSKKQTGDELLDTSDEESINEATTPATPSSISKDSTCSTTSPSSVSSMSTVVRISLHDRFPTTS